MASQRQHGRGRNIPHPGGGGTSNAIPLPGGAWTLAGLKIEPRIFGHLEKEAWTSGDLEIKAWTFRELEVKSSTLGDLEVEAWTSGDLETGTWTQRLGGRGMICCKFDVSLFKKKYLRAPDTLRAILHCF